MTAVERADEQFFRLTEAAAFVLDEHGSTGVTVDRVIARARVGRNTFYEHFDNISAILGAVRSLATETLFARVEAARREGRTPLETLRALSEAWLTAIQEEPVMARALLSHTVGADPRRTGSEAIEKWIETLRDVLEDARRAGAVRAANADDVEERLRLSAVAGEYYTFGIHAATSGMETARGAALLADLALSALR